LDSNSVRSRHLKLKGKGIGAPKISIREALTCSTPPVTPLQRNGCDQKRVHGCPLAGSMGTERKKFKILKNGEKLGGLSADLGKKFKILKNGEKLGGLSADLGRKPSFLRGRLRFSSEDIKVLFGIMAEREGFEPPIRLPRRRFSKPVHSTTLPSLRIRTIQGMI
jgi:hypothetical protein